MWEVLAGALLIGAMRIADVTLGTFRMIMIVQAKKHFAAAVGFVEVLIWIFAMRFIVENLDETLNLIAYAGGFAIGNYLGISLEEKVALGYVQLNVISKHFADTIADKLRESKYGVTILPAEGISGGMAILVIIIRRKDLKKVTQIIEGIDANCFITVQHSRPFRGYIHGARK